MVATRLRETGNVMVIVAPITHAPPEDHSASIQIPRAVSRSLGLDGREHWVRLDELNRFAWPGYDLRMIQGRSGEYAYGMLPEPLFEQIRAGILDRQSAKAPRVQGRD